jgi:hypothetical protein
MICYCAQNETRRRLPTVAAEVRVMRTVVEAGEIAPKPSNFLTDVTLDLS